MYCICLIEGRLPRFEFQTLFICCGKNSSLTNLKTKEARLCLDSKRAIGSEINSKHWNMKMCSTLSCAQWFKHNQTQAHVWAHAWVNTLSKTTKTDTYTHISCVKGPAPLLLWGLLALLRWTRHPTPTLVLFVSYSRMKINFSSSEVNVSHTNMETSCTESNSMLPQLKNHETQIFLDLYSLSEGNK